MSEPNMKCRVCDKEYFCCSDSKNIGSWRTMACSIECYKEYMNRIEESRNPKSDITKADIEKKVFDDHTGDILATEIPKCTKRKNKIKNDED